MARPNEAAPAIIYKEGDDVIIDGEEFTPAVQTVYEASVELTDAQVKALPTTGITIVAAQGANTIILPVSAFLRLSWVADYTNIDSGCQLRVRIGSSDGLLPIRQEIASSVSGLLAGGGPDGSIAFTGPYILGLTDSYLVHGGSSGFYDSDLANLPLKIIATNGAAGDFTGGNAGNTLTVNVGYRIIDIS